MDTDVTTINKDFVLDYNSLMNSVDKSSIFTLEDIFIICKKSKIPMDILCKILQCKYIPEFIDESEVKCDDVNDDMEYLELYYESGANVVRSSWGFHGVGFLGKISEDIMHCISEDSKPTYREKYAIEYTPVNKLIKYNININNKKCVIDSFEEKHIDFCPTLTVIELLYYIFYELSFCGGVKERNIQLSQLKEMLEERDV